VITHGNWSFRFLSAAVISQIGILLLSDLAAILNGPMLAKVGFAEQMNRDREFE
jgi:hypothetical protein